MRRWEKAHGMENKSEYLIVYVRGCNKLAMLLDANLDKIADYNADSEDVASLLKLAKTLGPIDDDNWGNLAGKFSPEERANATAYRLHV
jgi:hypothetical protein